MLIQENVRKLFKLEDDFGQVIRKTKVNVNFLFKLRFHLDRVEKKQQKIKLRKLRSLSPNSVYKKLLIERFYEDLPHFRFKLDFVKFCNSNVEDFENLFNILTLDNMPGFIKKNKVPFNSVKNLVVNRHLYLDFENNEREVVNSRWDFVSGELSEDNSNDSEVAQEIDDNRAQLKDNRLEAKFVSKNVINLSQRQLTKSEISLLSKGLKFVPTPNMIDKAKLKQELEVFGRKLRLMWHFRNDERIFDCNTKFRPKSTFNPKNKDVTIETYLSSLEENLLDIDIPKDKFNNLSKEERDALYSLKNDNTIVIKGAGKGSAVVVWDREDYLKEAHKQLSDEEVCEEVTNDPSTLESTIFTVLNKIRARGDLSADNLEYFLNKDPKFARFYLLPKNHKRLHNVPGRPVISNCGYYTENISSFLDYHLKPLAKKVESYIKDTNHFLKKLKELGSLPKNAILCTIDVVGLYPNIPHKEGLASIRKHLDNRENKEVTTDTLVELADIVLKNNYFQFLDKIFKQKRGTAIGTKFAPPYYILFMADLEKHLLSDIDLKPYIW